MPLPKTTDGAKVWLLHRRHRHEIHPLLAAACNPPRRVDPLTVGVQQQARHHHRVIRRVAPLLFVAVQNRRQVQLLPHEVAQKMRDMTRRDQLPNRRREEPDLVHFPTAESLCHERLRSQNVSPVQLPIRAARPAYSDRLLARKGWARCPAAPAAGAAPAAASPKDQAPRVASTGAWSLVPTSARTLQEAARRATALLARM